MRMRAAGVGEQVCESVSDHVKQPSDESVKHVPRAHRDTTSGHGHALADDLCGVGQETLEHRRADTCPNQTRRDVLVAGIECMQVGVGLPFFETELDLPAKAIQLADHLK